MIGPGSRLPAEQRQTIRDTADAIEAHHAAVSGPWRAKVQQALAELPPEVACPIVIGRDEQTSEQHAAIRAATIASVPVSCDRCGESLAIVPDPAAEYGHRPETCPKCFSNADAILIAAEAMAERDRRAGDTQHRLRTRREAHAATVPTAYRRASITNYQTHNGNEIAAHQYLDGLTPETWPDMLTLGGPPGTGKTYLGAGICRRWRFRFGREPLMIDEAHVAQFWRDAHSRDNRDDPTSIINTLTTADLLVIDDLGKARPTPGWSSELHGVFDTRLQAQRPTVTTTNLNRASLTEAYGERFGPSLVSRLGAGVVLPVDGPDRRRGWAS
ncbi:MAG: hypothetical protein AAGG38_07360 [Planctomycetota bacterium]